MSCRIVIDTPGPFYSGTQIQGKLVCTFNGNQKIRGIKIRAHGDEHTEWWGTESYYNSVEKRTDTRSVLFTGDNNLFGLEQMLYGGSSGDIHVGPGTFSYPFSFQLPHNLPSTFENSNGYIRYTLKGIVDVPWGLDHEDKVHFVVVSLIDLNDFPHDFFQPVSRSENKTICCWCCAGGDITVDLNISKTAFVPGESVKLYLALTNMSNSNVDEIEAKLTQFIKSKVESPNHETRTDDNVLSANSWPGVGAHGENKLDIELPIPTDILVPNLDRSSLFEVYYEVQLTASIPGCHSDIDLSFIVNFGHIQHNSQLGGQQPAGYPPANFGGPPGGSYPQPSDGGYPQPSGGIYPQSPSGGYPQPSNETTFPSGPYPNMSGPYPPGAPYPAAGFVSPSAPAGPAQYPNDAPSYSSVTAGGPSEKTFQPGGAQYSAHQQGGQMNPKEREFMEGGGGAAPSAPRSELPPPSYDDVTKKN